MQTKSTEETNQAPAEEVKSVAKPKPLKTISKVKSAVAKPVAEDQPTVERKVVVAKTPVKTPAKIQPPKAVAPKIPISDQIWNTIKERELGLFGLTGQTVEKYCQPMNTDPSRCMVKYKVSSVIPALEAAVPDFDFEVMGVYLIISPKK